MRPDSAAITQPSDDERAEDEPRRHALDEVENAAEDPPERGSPPVPSEEPELPAGTSSPLRVATRES